MSYTPVVTITFIIHSSNKIQNGDILVPANQGPPGKKCLLEETMTHCTVIGQIRIKHRQNIELVNIAKQNHASDNITVIIES